MKKAKFASVAAAGFGAPFLLFSIHPIKEVKYAVKKRYESSTYPCSGDYFGWLHKCRHPRFAAVIVRFLFQQRREENFKLVFKDGACRCEMRGKWSVRGPFAKRLRRISWH
jgi:hypothetical protein